MEIDEATREALTARRAEIVEQAEQNREATIAHETARDAARAAADQTRADVDAIRRERRDRLS